MDNPHPLGHTIHSGRRGAPDRGARYGVGMNMLTAGTAVDNVTLAGPRDGVGPERIRTRVSDLLTTTDTRTKTSSEARAELLTSFAELEALLRATPGWPAVRTALGIQPPADEQVALAGLASLIVRNLARIAANNVPEVQIPVADLTRKVGMATDVITVIFDPGGGTTQAFILCGGRNSDDRVMLSVIGLGVIQLQTLVDYRSLRDLAAVLASNLLDTADGTVHIHDSHRLGVTIRKFAGDWQVETTPTTANALFSPIIRPGTLDPVSAVIRGG